MLKSVGSILKYQNKAEYSCTYIAHSSPKWCIMSHIFLHEPRLNSKSLLCFISPHRVKRFEENATLPRPPGEQVLERLHSVSTTRSRRIHLFHLLKIKRGENYLASEPVNYHGLTIS